METNWPTNFRLKLIYGIALLVIQFLIPTIIMAYCYWKILQKVRTKKEGIDFRFISFRFEIQATEIIIFVMKLQKFLGPLKFCLEIFRTLWNFDFLIFLNPPKFRFLEIFDPAKFDFRKFLGPTKFRFFIETSMPSPSLQ